MDFALTFTPFDALAASELNTIMANLNALKDGSAIDDGAISPAQRAGGYTTGTIAVSSGGAKSITAPGFEPKGLKIYGVVTTNNSISADSMATFDGTTLRCKATSGSGASGFSRFYNNFTIINVDPAPVVTVTSFAFTSTGFTCSVTTSSADVTVWYEAVA